MFKDRFKYYKSRDPPPKLDHVVDFNSPNSNKSYLLKQLPVQTSNVFYGLKSPVDWELYALDQHPGFLFLRNPFSAAAQRYWIARCLKCYPRKPNKTNLDVHNLVPDNENWWEYTFKKEAPVKLREKLRWVTFGYHHNWDTKVYSEDSYSVFPKDLNELCLYIANALGFPHFKSEAAIVNYYHLDSTLSGHTDHSEENLEAPLFSFSFGQTAIFLLGGKTIEDVASAMFLRSGDVAIMTQESRLCYHGVPKILPAEEEVWNLQALDQTNVIPPEYIDDQITNYLDKPDYWQPYSDYLNHSRININVRQVLKKGQEKLSFIGK